MVLFLGCYPQSLEVPQKSTLVVNISTNWHFKFFQQVKRRMGFLFDVNSSTSFFVADSENPAEKEDPTFKLAKVHSASTVISNLSLISASIESDLDSKVGGSNPDVSSIGGSSMRAKNSIITRPVKSEAQPSYDSSRPVVTAEPERRNMRAISKSQVLPVNSKKHSESVHKYASFNGHIPSNKRQPSTSSVTDHSRTSSIPDPSDSDIDSYSDIVGQQSWKDTVISNKGVDLSVESSRRNTKQRVANVVPTTWASSAANPAGSVISFGGQQRRVIEDQARTTKQNSKSYDSLTNGTRQSAPNVYAVSGKESPRENGTFRGRAQRRTRSESQDVVLQNGPRATAYGRSKSIPRQRGNGSSDEEESEQPRNTRWKGSATDLRANRVIIGAYRTNQPELLRVSSVDSPTEAQRASSNRITPTRNGEFRSNHADQLAAEMQQGRKNSLSGRKQSFPNFRDDSQSSQDSTDYESRQTAAEQAAVALMTNRATRVPTQSLNDVRHSQRPVEMVSMGTENRKLRREHLANLAHLQSSSC